MQSFEIEKLMSILTEVLHKYNYHSFGDYVNILCSGVMYFSYNYVSSIVFSYSILVNGKVHFVLFVKSYNKL